jgi:putative membrane protein
LNTVAVRRALIATVAVVLGIAVFTPLDDSLTGHMVQHVLLIAVAAPALALLVPVATLDSARWYALTALAIVAESVVVVGWHAPAAFDAALRTDPLHGIEHLTMLASATALWWLLARTYPRRGEGVIALFVTTIPMTVLGLGLLLSSTPWYEAYPDVGDQQVAGAVMWGIGGAIAVFQGAALFIAWLLAVDPTFDRPRRAGWDRANVRHLGRTPRTAPQPRGRDTASM